MIVLEDIFAIIKITNDAILKILWYKIYMWRIIRHGH